MHHLFMNIVLQEGVLNVCFFKAKTVTEGVL